MDSRDRLVEALRAAGVAAEWQTDRHDFDVLALTCPDGVRYQLSPSYHDSIIEVEAVVPRRLDARRTANRL